MPRNKPKNTELIGVNYTEDMRNAIELVASRKMLSMSAYTRAIVEAQVEADMLELRLTTEDMYEVEVLHKLRIHKSRNPPSPFKGW